MKERSMSTYYLKSIIALKQKMSVPRLEFLALLTGMRSFTFISKELKFESTKIITWNIEVAQTCSVRKVFSEILQKSQENTCARVSILIKLQAWACSFIKKETLAQVFSCDFCEISKEHLFHRTPLGDCF